MTEAGAANSRTPASAKLRSEDRRARTQGRLLAAARSVFERDGFHQARLFDIVEEAQVSIGTFYNYYDSKEEIFRDVMGQVAQDLVSGGGEVAGTGADPVAGIAQGNLAYIRGYRRNAKLMSLLLQVAEQDAEVRDLRLEIRHSFESRLSRAIKRWQDQGLAWDDIDPVYAANALAYMVDRFLYEWVVLDLDYDEAEAVYTLTRLWARGLGLERPAAPTRRRTRTGTASRGGAGRPKSATVKAGVATSPSRTPTTKSSE